jgi:oxygen-independent coproporphyrinogen-3 oxidase
VEQQVVFDSKLIQRYDKSGPRYTSYPTAVQFHEGVGDARYRAFATASNDDPIPRSLSLYFHIPFCATVCYYCACNKIVTKNRGHASAYVSHLQQEIALQGKLFDRDRTVNQLHWGGGTPTFLNQGQMRTLMRTTAKHFHLLDGDRGEYRTSTHGCRRRSTAFSPKHKPWRSWNVRAITASSRSMSI